MAVAEDATSVLDLFINDAANLPAEMAHIMEEIRAKDKDVQDTRTLIHQHDAALQRYVKQYGVQQPHPKEEQFNKTVKSNYDKAVLLQNQKIALCDKAATLLDRHVKRLDLKIRDLVNEGAMQEDLTLPSVLRDSPGNLVDPNSNTGTGTNTPRTSFPYASGGIPNIANAAMARMANHGLVNGRGVGSSAAAGMQPHPLMNGSSSASTAQNRRESSASISGSDAKRRRLHLGTLPDRPSNLARQTSLGPGTPKAGTPGSRAGSAGPRMKKTAKNTKQEESMRKKVGKSQTKQGKGQRRVGKASPSTTDNDEDSDASGSEVAAGRGSGNGAAGGHDGAADDDVDGTGYEDDDEEVDDNKIYCVCNSVSHGDMVACDNQRCQMEWFHWNCVGLTQEPKGRWLCPNCEKLPKSQIKYSKAAAT